MNLSHDSGSGWHCHIWKTDKAWTGTFSALAIQLVAGTEQQAYFSFR